MFQRLISFIRSDKKRALLRYYIYEVKGDLNRLRKRILPELPLSAGRNAGKINLNDQANRIYGTHRSELSTAVALLQDLHNPGGILFDSFIDRTFAANAVRKTIYTKPWIGIIHIPPNVPEWLHSAQTNEAIFATDEWLRSVPFCRGLFTLSAYHKNHLIPKFNFPVDNLLHPTEFPELKWSLDRFVSNREKKIIQAGWWLRRVTSIYLLEAKGYHKVVLMKQDADAAHHLKLELTHLHLEEKIGKREIGSVQKTDYLSNKKYDQWLSENIVFLDLFDASANNAIIECIARNTPLLVNPIEPVVEYLGADYPLYFSSLAEAAEKAEDLDLVKKAHLYLAEMPDKRKLTNDYFRESFENSNIYRSL
ncbi:MAG: hypothetical protein NTW16_17030 [Bacteroidetes bacterium]|nr:hypothetical protein [Bacteroidota bacterium]